MSLWLLLALAVIVTASPAAAYQREFSGEPLTRLLKTPAEITCESEQATSTGFYPENWIARMGDPEGVPVHLRAVFQGQADLLRWAITVEDKHALVAIGDQARGERYDVVQRGPWGIVLMRIKPGTDGAAVQVLTIDPQNGSFVSSDASVGPVWNRTGVWVGRCR